MNQFDDYDDFSIPIDDLYDRISNDENLFTMQSSTEKGKFTPVIGTKFNDSTLFSIEKFVMEIMNSVEPAFGFIDIEKGVVLKKRLLQNYFLAQTGIMKARYLSAFS